jgi:hypothetical protein
MALRLAALTISPEPFSIPRVKARVKTHVTLKHLRDFIEYLTKNRTLKPEKSEEEHMKLCLQKMDSGFRGP